MFFDIVLSVVFGPLPVAVVHLIVRILQAKDVRAGRIPPRGTLISGTNQQFLHAQELLVMVWGDLVGLSAVWAASIKATLKWWGRDHTLWFVTASALIGLIAGFFFHHMCLQPNHKPDYGFPRSGVASRAGIVHSIFLGLSFAIGCMGLGYLATSWSKGDIDDEGIILTCAWITGFTVWLIAGLIDYGKGRFDDLDRSP